MDDWATITSTGTIPKNMIFLRDSMPLKIVDKKVIKESSENGRPSLKITGIFQRADQINANGRIYPRDVLEGAIADIAESIKARRVMGEFDHPPDAKIHMDRVSHLITGLWMDRDVMMGEAEVLEAMEPCGKNLKALLEAGVQVGISSRGVGDMKTTQLKEGEECYEVQPGYSLVTFDAVAEPSVPGSYLSPVMESRQRKIVAVKRQREKLIAEEVKKIFFRGHNFETD